MHLVMVFILLVATVRAQVEHQKQILVDVVAQLLMTVEILAIIPINLVVIQLLMKPVALVVLILVVMVVVVTVLVVLPAQNQIQILHLLLVGLPAHHLARAILPALGEVVAAITVVEKVLSSMAYYKNVVLEILILQLVQMEVRQVILNMLAIEDILIM